MSLRFGTDGVRGVALTELTTDYVRLLGRAAAEVLGGERWYVARDTRESGSVLEGAFAEGLFESGATVDLLGVLPTPGLALLGALDGVPAAMITASHNPFSDNGVKVFAAGGRKLADDVERRIEAALERMLGGDVPPAQRSVPSHVDDVEGATDRYVDHLVGHFAPDALRGLRLVLDTANGAMCAVAPAVARRLGADVIVLHDDPDGRNINDACGATDPRSLSEAVVAHGADLGLAFDGDGDRVIAVDHEGRVVDGDPVVVTVMTNLGFRRAMEHAGVHVVETAVGDRYVLEALDAGGYAIGGEQSGHIILRRLATTGDGLLAGLRLALHVSTSGRTLADLAGSVMTSYPQVLVNVRVRERHPQVADELSTEIAAATERLDGEGRILVRASGTEPLVRVMVEAATEALARSTADDLAEVVRQRFA
jgi:phosphoglucosamine mutase